MSAQTYATAGQRLLRAGFQPIPVAGKRPVVKHWESLVLHPDQVDLWATGDKGRLNVGLRTDDLVAIDIDIYDLAAADAVEAAALARFGDAPKRVGEAPKRLLLYAAKRPGTKITSPVFSTVDGFEHRVEVLGVGQQFVALGTHPDTLRPYTWPDRDILDIERWELPVVDRDEVAQWVEGEVVGLLMRRGFLPHYAGSTVTRAGGPMPDPDDAFDAVKATHDDVSLADLQWMLDTLDPNYCDERDSWRNAIFAVHHQFGHTALEAEAFDALDAWSARSAKYTAGCVAAIWREAKDQRGAGLVTIGTLKAWLGEAWKLRKAQGKASSSAALIGSADWKARIDAAVDVATLQGALSAEIRAAKLTDADRATLVKRLQIRWRTLEGVSLDKKIAEHLFAPPKQDPQLAAEVDLQNFIPFGMAVPPLDPIRFPHSTITPEGEVFLKTTIENIESLLEGYRITAHYDVIRKKPVINVPGLVTCPDQADSAALIRIKSLATLNGLIAQRADEYALEIAFRNSRNVIADWIKSAPWDGQDRIGQLQETLTLREGFPPLLRNLIVRRWLISAVAAAMRPRGFYSKGVLTLQGPQSIGKSPWIAGLIPSHLADYLLTGAHLNPDNRDSVKTAVSHWIVELGEVDATMRKADVAHMKAFLSNATDKLRLPYAKADSEYDRRTVFAASVNPEQFLVDETGNVRWWTVPVVAINYRHGIDMQQLWAQVATFYEAEERWWLVREEELQLELWNAGHVVKTAIHDALAAALNLDAPKKDWRKLPASDVLTELGYKTPTNPQTKDCGNALRALLGAPIGTTKGTSRWLVPPIVLHRPGMLRAGDGDITAFD